jgi:transposase InsO family protein
LPRQPGASTDCVCPRLLRPGSDELGRHHRRGITSEMVRDLMVEAVEARFGAAPPAQPIGWLTDNGSPYIARDTRSFAREIA